MWKSSTTKNSYQSKSIGKYVSKKTKSLRFFRTTWLRRNQRGGSGVRNILQSACIMKHPLRTSETQDQVPANSFW